MSKKWFIISTLGILLPVAALLIWYAILPDDFRVGRELQKRGFDVIYDIYHRHPFFVVSESNITPEDSRLICQLPRLETLFFTQCDMSGLNLDEIGSCRELSDVAFFGVTQFPANEIRKLTVCPIRWITVVVSDMKDSDLECFLGLTKLEYLELRDNIGITDAGLEHLEKIPSLKILRLDNTSITPEGLKDFKKKRSDIEVSEGSPWGI